MKFALFLLFILALFPARIFSQDIELGGTDLNGNDIIDWNTPPVSIPAPSANMMLADSVMVKSNFDRDGFYTEVIKILKAAGFETASGIDYKTSGLKAHKTMHDVEHEIVVTYYPKIFHSSTLPNNARVTFYATAARSELNGGDVKSLEKIKNEFVKQLKNSSKEAHALATTLKTNDEQRVVNQFSRRAIPAIDLIDGVNTLQMIADKARMLKEEVAQIFAFLIEKGFAHVAKHGS